MSRTTSDGYIRTMIVGLVVASGAAAAAIVAMCARRWPVIEAPAGIPRSTAVVGAASAAAGIGALLGVVRAEVRAVRWIDVRLAALGARHATPWSTDALRVLSLAGGTGGVIAIAVVATAIEHRRRPTRAVPIFMSAVVVGQLALSNGIKLLVDRVRPDYSRLTGFAGTSFPSGHATSAAATLAAVAMVSTRGRSGRARGIAASVAAGMAVVVAGTRVFLGVHWFTDVVAGLLLGWGWFALCSIAVGGRMLTLQPL